MILTRHDGTVDTVFTTSQTSLSGRSYRTVTLDARDIEELSQPNHMGWAWFFAIIAPKITRQSVRETHQWERHRFKTNGEDYRPVKFPPPGPYWCTGHAPDHSYSVVVAYLPPGEPVTNWWPEATDIDSETVDAVAYTDRMPRPHWWHGA